MIAGCQSDKEIERTRQQSGQKLLGKTLQIYCSMKSVIADILWSFGELGQPAGTEKRELRFQSPNKFYIASSLNTDKSIKVVCDGVVMKDYSLSGDRDYPAPTSLSSASTDLLNRPELCGLLFLKFFQSSPNLQDLAPMLNSIREVEPALVNNRKCRVVQFDAGTPFGMAHVAINEASGLIEMLAFERGQRLGDRNSQGLPVALVTERITKFQMNIPEFQANEFDTISKPQIPDGEQNSERP